MPSFVFLSEQERRAAVEYLKQLTAKDDGSGKLVSVFDRAKAEGRSLAPIAVPPEPPPTLEALTRGRKLFADLKCITCHGETGVGDGPSAPLPVDFPGGENTCGSIEERPLRDLVLPLTPGPGRGAGRADRDLAAPPGYMLIR